MTFNPLDEKGIPIEDQLRNCSELNVEPVRYPAFRSAGPAPERAADHRVTAPPNAEPGMSRGHPPVTNATTT